MLRLLATGRSRLYHVFVGNDIDPFAVAVCRALFGAFLTGALAFLAVWATTNDPKTLAIAGLTPFLTYLAARAGIEGIVDNWKNGVVGRSAEVRRLEQRIALLEQELGRRGGHV